MLPKNREANSWSRMTESPFELTHMDIQVSLPPSFAADVDGGVKQALNEYLMRYHETVGGVVLTFTDVVVTEKSGMILGEMPHFHFSCRVCALVFRPVPGMKLRGTVNKVGSDHVGLLVAGLFNASVAADGLPQGYKFDVVENEWRDTSGGGKNLTVGSDVVMVAQRLYEAEGLVSVSGALLAVEGEGEQGSTQTEASNPQTASGQKRKRKLSTAEDVDDGETEATSGDVVKMEVEESVGGQSEAGLKKKKKKKSATAAATPGKKMKKEKQQVAGVKVETPSSTEKPKKKKKKKSLDA